MGCSEKGTGPDGAGTGHGEELGFYSKWYVGILEGFKEGENSNFCKASP